LEAASWLRLGASDRLAESARVEDGPAGEAHRGAAAADIIIAAMVVDVKHAMVRGGECETQRPMQPRRRQKQRYFELGPRSRRLENGVGSGF
jgi:hypothetical protein